MKVFFVFLIFLFVFFLSVWLEEENSIRVPVVQVNFEPTPTPVELPPDYHMSSLGGF